MARINVGIILQEENHTRCVTLPQQSVSGLSVHPLANKVDARQFRAATYARVINPVDCVDYCSTPGSCLVVVSPKTYKMPVF